MFEREDNPRGIKQADIVVGLASYKEADSIAFPTQQASEGLVKYFGDRTSCILNCDNHSPDDTRGAFLSTMTEVPKIYITTPPNMPGKGYNFENMFRKVLELDAKVLVCLDADLLSVTPEWVKYFVEPVLDGYDFVNPIYSRHKYDGTITNNICFPLIYGLFCRNIRQPIGGDFSLSRQFAQHLVCLPWHRTTEEYGIDIFMSMNAILGGFRQCNTGLGAKIHKPSAPKLGPMFIQVVSTAFLTTLRGVSTWNDKTDVHEPKHYGLQTIDPPQDLEIDRAAIEKQARYGFTECQADLEGILTPDLYWELTSMFTSGGTIDISADQWVTVVYDSIAAFAQTRNQEALVESLKGLYFGRALSFMNQTWDQSTEEAEDVIVEQANVFHKRRGYLLDKLTAQGLA
jgi:hypothetical protein